MKKDNKITFWGTIISAIKEGIKRYKAEMNEQINKHKLLSSKSDWSMIEAYIQRCNDNPDLRVDITLVDGTQIKMKTYIPEKVKDYDLLEIK